MDLKFKKEERLAHKTEIKNLLRRGNKIRLFPFVVFYSKSREKDEPHPIPLKIAISIPKRTFKKAVDRNLLKRRCREAYRINRMPLKEKMLQNQTSLSFIFIYKAKTSLSYSEIEDKIILILRRLQEVHE